MDIKGLNIFIDHLHKYTLNNRIKWSYDTNYTWFKCITPKGYHVTLYKDKSNYEFTIFRLYNERFEQEAKLKVHENTKDSKVLEIFEFLIGSE